MGLSVRIRYLGLSETVLIFGQLNVVQDNLSGLLSLDWLLDQIRAQDFVTVFLKDGGCVRTVRRVMERKQIVEFGSGLAHRENLIR